MMNRTSLIGVLGAVMISVVACGHEIDSPGPSAAPPVDPDLVCVEQLTTNVSLKGDGFVPMPTNTLAGDVHLVMPKVVLAQKQGLDGMSPDASACATLIGNAGTYPSTVASHPSSTERPPPRASPFPTMRPTRQQAGSTGSARRR